jgi:ferredoxin
MRINVERSRCEGYGFCEEKAPSLLRLDDDGNLEILGSPSDAREREQAQQAVRSCPVAALLLEGS